MKTITASLLIISFLMPSFASAFSYEPDKPLAQYPEEGIFLGVCAGLARKTGIAPIYFRAAFVLSALMGGIGIPLYFILAVIMPTRHSVEEVTSPISLGKPGSETLPPADSGTSTSPPTPGPDSEKGNKVTPQTYFRQVDNIMREMEATGKELMIAAITGKIGSQLEYFQKLRDETMKSRDKFNDLTVPSECEEIYQLFSEYFRYYILSMDVAIEGLESGDAEKIKQAEIESKSYAAKGNEFYEQAKTKILNWK